MASPSGAAQPAGAGAEQVELKAIRIPEARTIDGLKLIETESGPVLIYSREEEAGQGSYQLVLVATTPSDPSRATPLVRIGRLLPSPPLWDARRTERGTYEFTFEVAGGAINAIQWLDGTGKDHSLSSAHPFESFHRPHFVRAEAGGAAVEVGAVADKKAVVVFPLSVPNSPYARVAEGADGIVGGTTRRWVVTKTPVGGPAQRGVLPGRLALVKGDDRASTPFPDILAYEFDAASLPGDVVVFATARPALLILGSRPSKPFLLTADDRRLASALSRPTVSVGPGQVRLAAIAHAGEEGAVVLYGEIPLRRLSP